MEAREADGEDGDGDCPFQPSQLRASKPTMVRHDAKKMPEGQQVSAGSSTAASAGGRLIISPALDGKRHL